jgi:hypothetical protein
MIRKTLFICTRLLSGTACARVDFLDMGRLNGQWQIVNVLWENRQP